MRMIAIAFLILGAMPAAAQNMTTAAEIKPILTVTKASWVAVREWEGQDLVYFTNLLAWRCGVTSVSYGINGADAITPLAMEPCYEAEPSPNALKMDQGVLPYIEAALGSVETLNLIVTYDDGTTDSAEYARAAVLMP